MRFSCPKTSQQNGKAERIIRTINDMVRTLLFQSNLPASFWVEALHMAVHLLNILPTTTLRNDTPFHALFRKHPSYDHLRVFGCLCYPNLSSYSPHKLSPRSSACIFLGYPSEHRGYRCLDLTTHKIHISRHVIFDESTFPYGHPPPSSSYDFLDHELPPAVRAESSHPSASCHEPPSLTPPPASRHQMSPSPSPPASRPNVPNPAPPPPPPPRHPMVTRSRSGIHKPRRIFNLSVESPIPSSHVQALQDPNWQLAMQDEFDAMIKNRTWDLVPRPSGANVIRSMWLYKHKYDANGNLQRHKARLVANGKGQVPGIDCGDTFSPVVKPATIRSVLSIALSKSWPIHQLDVKNAFLHGHLEETVYMHQPPGFKDPARPDHVCLLRKSLYGLKQAPRAWFQGFADYLLRIGFQASKSDASLFIYKHGGDMAYILLYVDDIVLTASSSTLLRRLIDLLSAEFAMSDLGPLHYFLGIAVTRSSQGLFLSQGKYAREILQRAHMANCKPVSTPVDTKSKLRADTGAPVSDPQLYRQLAGALQYLTFTRPDISYAVQQICLFMHDPREPHMQALKRILRYLQGSLDLGLQLLPSTVSGLTAYSDADWAGCPDTRRSTSGYCVYLGDNLISWSSKRQATVSRYSAEAEYRSVANVVAEACWLRNLFAELHCPISRATVVYCDNVSAVYLASNPVQHQRTKHIEIDIHFVRDKVTLGQVRVVHVPSSSQYADIFTKGLPSSLFLEFRSSLCVRPPPASTAGV